MGLYHPQDGITNPKFKLLYFLTPNKKEFEEKGTIFWCDGLVPQAIMTHALFSASHIDA